MTNFRIIVSSAVAWVLLPFFSLASFAETVRMKTGTILEGTIDKMDAGTMTIKDKDGKLKTVKRDEIANIDFPAATPAPLSDGEKSKNLLEVAPKAQSKYSTPVQTFEVWRRAAIEGDIEGMSDCYVSYRKSDVKKELKKTPKEEFNKMRATTAQTDFIPAEPLFQGERASLEVNWRLGISGDSQVLQFTLEKNDWKIIQ